MTTPTTKTDVAEFGALFLEADIALHSRFSVDALDAATQNVLQTASKLTAGWEYSSYVYAAFLHTHITHASHASRTVKGSVTLRALGDQIVIDGLRPRIAQAPGFWTIAIIGRSLNGGIRLCADGLNHE